MRNGLILLAVGAVVAAALPARTAAQTEVAPPAGDGAGACTMSCGCTATMCGCSRTGGKGGACRTDGDGCTVFACPGALLSARSSLALAADGSVVRITLGATEDDPAELSASRPVRWRTDSRGHSVGLDCQGAVVAEYFDPRSAAASRRLSRRLTL